MTKISLNSENEEIEITRSIGKSGDGKITINREGGGAIGINLGIASFGLTTDYGGAISLGIAGQEVTWGREGGTIHIKVGPFQVDVEARDCIVTEIKSIAGIIVAQRSYPDPGCKLPDPPLPPPNLPVPAPSPTVKNEITLPDSDKIGWCVFTEIIDQHGSNFFYRVTVDRTATDREETPKNDSRIPFSVTIVSSDLNYQLPLVVPKGSYLYPNPYIRSIQGVPSLQFPVLTYYYSRYDFAVVCFFGSASTIKKIISEHNAYTEAVLQSWQASNSPYGTTVVKYYPTAFIPLEGAPARHFLPTGNKPPMRDCCEEILDELADIKEAFDIDRMLRDKFPVSNTFMAPGCDSASVTVAKNYYEALQCVFRTLAHGLIFEPKVLIKDADAAKAGDQEFKAHYLNATGWASAMAEALLEAKDDGNVGTNMDIRNGFAATQTMVGMADAIYRIDAMLDAIGVELIPIAKTVETPFNVQIQIGKGFGEKNERQIDLNTDQATEKLLPEFLQTKKNKIKTVDVHPRSRSIKEILENIEANLPGGTNG